MKHGFDVFPQYNGKVVLRCLQERPREDVAGANVSGVQPPIFVQSGCHEPLHGAGIRNVIRTGHNFCPNTELSQFLRKARLRISQNEIMTAARKDARQVWTHMRICVGDESDAPVHEASFI